MLHVQAAEYRTLHKKNRISTLSRLDALNLVIVVVLIASALMISMLLAGNALVSGNMFPYGTSVNGYSIGGMSFEEGLEHVLEQNSAALNRFSVNLNYNGNSITLDAEELDIVDHISSLLLDASYSVEQTGPLSGVSAIIHPKEGRAIDLTPIWNTSIVQNTLQNALSESLSGYESTANEEQLTNLPMTGTEQVIDDSGNVHVFLSVNANILNEYVAEIAEELYPEMEIDYSSHEAVLAIKYNDLIEKYAERYSLDPAFVAAVIYVESRFEASSRSAVGAVGLMQIMPSTGRWIAEQIGMDASRMDLYDPETNLYVGCWYLSYLQKLYDGNVHTATIAYNAGPVRVNNWLKDSQYSSDGKVLDVIPFEETQKHTDKIESCYEIYKHIYIS